MKVKVKVHKCVDEVRQFRDNKTGASQNRRILTIGAFADDGELLSIQFYLDGVASPFIPKVGQMVLCDVYREQSKYP